MANQREGGALGPTQSSPRSEEGAWAPFRNQVEPVSDPWKTDHVEIWGGMLRLPRC